MKICVFCGGFTGHQREHAAAARTLAGHLVERGITLVYGGAHLGLMGTLADAMLEEGGEVIGVIPRSLMRTEVAHPSLSQLYVVEGLAERKHRMIQMADMFLALPGGPGTLNEISEVWTLAKLAHLNSPCGLLNTAGYYNAFLTFIRRAVAEGFLTHEHAELLIVGDQPADVLDRLIAGVHTDRRTCQPRSSLQGAP